MAEQVERDGGSALAVYQEPVGKAWQIFALLPLDRVHPTPYQRDLSQPHVKRLGEVIKKLNRFIDPLVVIRTEEGSYWTPNGNHRLAALKKLKAKFVSVVLIPDPNVAFQILALNTEKAHNLKDKSLEVIRMYRALMEAAGRSSEQEFAFQFEEAYFITLGLVYEKKARFAGSVFSPILRRVDKFLKDPLTKAFEERQTRAATLERVDGLLTEAVKALKSQGITHPYVKNFVIARVNPLSRARKTLPSFSQTFDKLEASLEKFDPTKIRMTDVARAGG
ncbi:MAG TPA: ParB N-terminal domain-containing protein [Vicinamibacteria bacterium]|jgi:ParB family chromosome partitioning protein